MSVRWDAKNISEIYYVFHDAVHKWIKENYWDKTP